MSREHSTNPVFQALRKVLHSPIPVAALWGVGAPPVQPHKVPFLKSAPKGLRLLHTASSVPEAEMLTQVLIAEGFQIEFVPSVTTGVFGITGNSEIYVAEADYDRAAQFLKEYLTPPEPESE